MDPISKKELQDLRRDVQPDALTPRIMDTMFISRNASTEYASTGGSRMVAADLMLEFTWQGVRYVLPVYKKK